MCLLAINYQQLAQLPILLAANREEFFDRPALPPRVQTGNCRVLCGTDLRAGGTWLGINEHGLVAAVTNRRKNHVPLAPRSRGLLCRELLEFDGARAACEYARRQLAQNQYAGANFAALDARQAFVIEAGDELMVRPLEPGLHLLTNGDLNDPCDSRQAVARSLFQAAKFDDAASFLDAAVKICGHVSPREDESIVVRGPDRGTVSSAILTLGTGPDAMRFLFANGPPNVTPYEDLTQLLLELRA
jgi:uncharacterized protein with NRDE domain